MGTFDRVATYSSAHDVDPLGLGRWSFISLKGKYDYNTRIVDAYITCKSQRGKYTTLYTQHIIWLRSQKDRRGPRKATHENLLRALSTRKSENKQIIMFCDHRKSAQQGHLARKLRNVSLYEGLPELHT